MSLVLSITEGWTDDLGPFTLKTDGAPLDLTGKTVSIILAGSRGGRRVPITSGGTLTVDPDQVTNKGKLSYKPVAADFKASRSPFTVRFRVVDALGDTVYFPNGPANTIAVYAP